jgi:hypothetical protein
MGETNRTVTSRVREVTAGTTPTSPAMKEMRVTANNLAYGWQREASMQINADLQPRDRVNLGYQPGGAIPFELSFKAFDDEIEEALRGTWNKTAERDNDGTADSVVTGVTASSDTYAVEDASEDFAPGHLVLASGFTNSGNNQLFKAQASTNGTAVIAPSSPGLTDESAPPGTARLKAVGFEGASGDITATATGLGSTLLDFTTLGVPVGGWVWVGGDAAGAQFATAACKGWARVSAVAANALTFDILPAGWTTDTGTSKTIQVFFGDLVTSGTTKRTVTIERQQQGIGSTIYEYFKGQALGQFSLPLTPNARVTGTLTYTGTAAAAPTTTRVSGATDVSAPTYPILSTGANLGTLVVNGTIVAAADASYITDLGFDINNSVERKPGIGTLGGVGVRHGEADIGGNFRAYLGDTTHISAAYSNTAKSLMFRLGQQDDNRQSYVFDAPRITLMGESPIDAKNNSRYFDGNWRAEKHTTLGYALSVGRFWYLPALVNG